MKISKRPMLALFTCVSLNAGLIHADGGKGEIDFEKIGEEIAKIDYKPRLLDNVSVSISFDGLAFSSATAKEEIAAKFDHNKGSARFHITTKWWDATVSESLLDIVTQYGLKLKELGADHINLFVSGSTSIKLSKELLAKIAELELDLTIYAS